MAPKEPLALPADVRKWLASDYQLGLEQNGMNFTKSCQQRKENALNDWAAGFARLDFTKMTSFELSVRLMRTVEFLGDSLPLEQLELQAHLTTIMNCEYHIYRLNSSTPLLNNPFLTYWLTTVATIQKTLAADLPPEGHEDGQTERLKQLVSKARLNIIHHALHGPDRADGVKVWARRHAIYESPEQLLQMIVSTSTARFMDLKSIDLEQYGLSGIVTLTTPSVDGHTNKSLGFPEADNITPGNDRRGSPASTSKRQSRSRSASFEAMTVESRHLGSSDPTQAMEVTATLTEDSRIGGSPFSGSPRVGSPRISSPLNDGSPRNGGAYFSAADLRERFASPGESSPRVNIVEHDLPDSTGDILDGADQSAEQSAATITPETSVMSIFRLLRESDYAEVIHALTRLPVDLNSLELLTNLLTHPLLVDTPVEPGPLVCGYIQHSLRAVERMTWSNSPRSDVQGEHGDDIFSDAVMVGGRNDQARAVRLLVLFLKNLLKRGIVQHQDLYFDVEEICVRYIWIPEVREFRKFLEGTDLIVEGASGEPPQGG